MRIALLAALALATLLAGCAENPSPVGDAEAAHAGASCGDAGFVRGFDAAGAPTCAAPPVLAGFACEPGHVVTGFDDAGAPVCRPIMEVAQEAEPPRPPEASRPAKSLSITSAGSLDNGTKRYTIASASPGMTWDGLAFMLDGRALEMRGAACADEAEPGTFGACSGGAAEAGADRVDAGDQVVLHGLAAGQTLRILDAEANAVILSLTVG